MDAFAETYHLVALMDSAMKIYAFCDIHRVMRETGASLQG
jgi:hypothetical protein